MNTPTENAREKFIDKHWGECITCAYFYKDFCRYHEEECENIEHCDAWRLNDGRK